MHKKHILILNILAETHFKTSFDRRIAEALQPIGIPYDTIYLDDLKDAGGFARYSHLLISGSTESAAGENEWYADLDAVIHHFICEDKAILGICFGHQFLVRHILGKEHVRKSATPEIGWTDITISDNPIFNRMNSLKSAVFHYDEVFDLDDRFEITASSARCAVHGFQVKNSPIWGLQFHPDFMYQDVFSFAEKIRENDDRFDEIHCRTAISQDEFIRNDRIFRNWLNI